MPYSHWGVGEGPGVRGVSPRQERMLDGLTLSVLSSRIKRNTSGDELVRCAVDAATAYENILNAIRAAEDAASKATSASESAFQVGTWSCTGGWPGWPRRQLTCSPVHGDSVNDIIQNQSLLYVPDWGLLSVYHLCVY